MLASTSLPGCAFPRLYLRGVPVTAWIEHRPGRHDEVIDWTLWIERHGMLSRGKSPTHLAIESRLRAWLLRRYHRPLATLSFAELCQIAEHRAGSSKKHNVLLP